MNSINKELYLGLIREGLIVFTLDWTSSSFMSVSFNSGKVGLSSGFVSQQLIMTSYLEDNEIVK